jgi:hypothetical protein
LVAIHVRVVTPYSRPITQTSNIKTERLDLCAHAVPGIDMANHSFTPNAGVRASHSPEACQGRSAVEDVCEPPEPEPSRFELVAGEAAIRCRACPYYQSREPPRGWNSRATVPGPVGLPTFMDLNLKNTQGNVGFLEIY